MDEYGWGLTSAGFRRPTYNELLDALEHKARELFGATANLTVRSPLGLFLRIFAWILNILFSVLEDVYNSRFVDTAVGTSLLNLGRAIGLRVLSAQKASGYIMVTGPPGVIVPAGWLVETAAGIQFFAVSDTEIGAEGTVMVPFRCTSTGPDGNVAADTITTITNPGSVAGITAVTNPAAFTGGRERETDEEFRDRYYASVDYAGGVNADSIRAALLQNVDGIMETSVYKGYKRDKIEMRVDRVEVSDFPLYLNTVAGGLDRRDQTIGGFSFVVKIYAVPVVEIIGQLLYLLGRYGFNTQFGDCL